MEKPQKLPKLCPVCANSIPENFCTNCGIQNTEKRVKFITAIGDMVDAFFSLDRSLWANMKEMLLRPDRFIGLYLEGYRRYYFNPGRFLLIATAILSVNFLINDNMFIDLTMNATGVSGSFLFSFMCMPVIALGGRLTYIKFKKNLFEHFVVTSYIFSFWVIIFSIISIALSSFEWNYIKLGLDILFFELIMFWYAEVFVKNIVWRIIYAIVNSIILLLGLVSFTYLLVSLTGLELKT